MSDLIKNLFEKTPKCLDGLTASIVTVELPRSWNAGALFTTKSIACKCGNKKLSLHTLQRKVSKGFFKKKEATEHYPPAKVYCGKCNNSTVIFNPDIHGWNGETAEGRAEPKESELTHYSNGDVKLYVNYSYQGIENYEDIVEEGVENPEDFFDTFTVLCENGQTDALVEVFSSECG